MELLYHYCTVEAFHAILTSGTVRLSSVRHSNDRTEGSMIREAIQRHAFAAAYDSEGATRLQAYAMELENQFDGMALCLSEKGDQLSQWRGYANDGRGVAIGFRKDKLEALSKTSEEVDDDFDIRLYKAVYKADEHDTTTRELFERVRQFDNEKAKLRVDDQRLKSLSERIEALHQLLLSLTAYDAVYSLKHEAFSERAGVAPIASLRLEQLKTRRVSSRNLSASAVRSVSAFEERPNNSPHNRARS